jgi:hypothetical protein
MKRPRYSTIPLFLVLFCYATKLTANNGFVISGDGNAQCTGCAIGYYVRDWSLKTPYILNASEMNISDINITNISLITEIEIVGTEGMSCEPCPAGLYSADNISTTCSVCPVGHSQMQVARGFCEPCVAGTFAREKQSKTCKECPQGLYQNSTGQDNCKLCPAGTYTRSYGSLNCTICEQGTYSNRGAKECRPCPAGSFGRPNSPGFCDMCPYTAEGRMQSSDVVGAVDELTANCESMDTIFGNCSERAATECTEGQYLSICGGISEGVCMNCTDLCPRSTTSHKCSSRNPGCCTLEPDDVCEAPFRERTGIELRAIAYFSNEEWQILNPTCGRGFYESLEKARLFLKNRPHVFDSFANISTNVSCDGCPVGTYSEQEQSFSIGSCLPCPKGTYANTTGNFECTRCGNGMVVTDYSTTGGINEEDACISCPRGRFLDITTCTVCERNSYSTGGSICISCGEHEYTEATGSKYRTDCICIDGYHDLQDGNGCKPIVTYECAEMQIQATIWSECIWCIPYQITNQDNTSCIQLNQSELTSVPSAQCSKNQVTSSIFNETANAYYVACVDCPLQNESDPTSIMYAGLDALVSKLQCSIGCRPGTYTYYNTPGESSGSNFTCPSCEPGHITTLFAETNCTPCAAGSYTLDTEYAMRCQLTPAGSYQQDPGKTDYIACDKGTFSLEGASTCIDCEPGTYNEYVFQPVCIECHPGTFSVSTARTTACDPCPGTTVSTGSGRTTCDENCPSGAYTRDDNSVCLPCEVGTAGTNGTCYECAPGSYQNTNGQTSCTSCNDEITPNQYQPNTAQTTCEYCTTGPANATSCLVCRLGTFFDENDNVCNDCPVGEYQNLTGQTSCITCHVESNLPVSTRLGSIECEQCELGTSRHTSTHCNTCPIGTYGDLPNMCTPCPVNTYGYREGATSVTYCAACPVGKQTFGITGAVLEQCGFCEPGMFLDREDNDIGNVCTECPKGSYYGSSGAVDKCTECPLGTYTNKTAATTCATCHPGSIADNTGTIVCTVCPPGFRDDGADMQTCFACQPGTKSINFECVACEQNTTSTAMATTCFACPDTIPAGKPAAILNHTCVCPVDTIRDQVGGTRCTRCSDGFSTRGTVNATYCQNDIDTTSTTAVLTNTDAITTTTTPVPATAIVTTTAVHNIPTTTTPAISTTTPPPTTPLKSVQIVITVLIPLPNEEISVSVIKNMRTVFARLAGVKVSSVTVTIIAQYDENARRRLLVTRSRVQFIINIPVVDEPISTTTTRAETIVTLLTDDTINGIIQNDPVLREELPDGILLLYEPEVIPPTEDIDDVEETDDLFILIAGGSGSIVILIVIIVVLYYCCCRKTKKSGVPQTGIPQGYALQPGMPQAYGMPQGYTPPPGMPQAYTPQPGMPQGYTPAPGMPQAYTPPSGTPQAYGVPQGYAPQNGIPQGYTPLSQGYMRQLQGYTPNNAISNGYVPLSHDDTIKPSYIYNPTYGSNTATNAQVGHPRALLTQQQVSRDLDTTFYNSYK